MPNEKMPMQAMSLLPGIDTCIQHSASHPLNGTQEHLQSENSANSGFNFHVNTPISFPNMDGIEFCAYMDEITGAIQTGRVHVGSGFVPQLFATTDIFEKFLSEMDVHYKRSVDRYGHTLRKVLIATDEIRRVNSLSKN